MALLVKPHKGLSLGGGAPLKKGRWHFLLPMLCLWSITRLTARPRFQYPDHSRSHVDGHKISGDEFDCSRIFGSFVLGGGKGLLRIMIIGNPWNPLPFVPTHNQDSFVFFFFWGGGGVFCLTKSQSDIIELELPLVEFLKQQFQFPWLNRQKPLNHQIFEAWIPTVWGFVFFFPAEALPFWASAAKIRGGSLGRGGKKKKPEGKKEVSLYESYLEGHPS